jgi:hypothetical protein
MNRYFWITICVFIGILPSNPASSATFNLSGDWQCNFSGAFSHGDIGCNTGPNPSASCTIEQTGDSFTLKLHSICDPGFTCFFEGTVAQATYAGANSGALDGGGTVVNTTTFTASSMTAASGSSYSQATFPDWNCTWGFDSLVLTRGATPSKYVLTVNVSGSGSVTLEPSGGIYDPGTLVTLAASPNFGWQFVSWSGDTEGSQNSEQIVMDRNKTVTATFMQERKGGMGALMLLLGD